MGLHFGWSFREEGGAGGGGAGERWLSFETVPIKMFK